MASDSLRFEGRIWILGDNIDTDQIVPSRVLTEQDPKKMAAATFEVVLPMFAKSVRKGDIIVGGKNFGCGSSREEAVFVLKSLGISAVIARSIARIFYRNMVNLGLPPIILPDITFDSLSQCSLGKSGDLISIDLSNGTITGNELPQTKKFKPFPLYIQEILQAGGAIPHILANIPKKSPRKKRS